MCSSNFTDFKHTHNTCWWDLTPLSTSHSPLSLPVGMLVSVISATARASPKTSRYREWWVNGSKFYRYTFRCAEFLQRFAANSYIMSHPSNEKAQSTKGLWSQTIRLFRYVWISSPTLCWTPPYFYSSDLWTSLYLLSNLGKIQPSFYSLIQLQLLW